MWPALCLAGDIVDSAGCEYCAACTDSALYAEPREPREGCLALAGRECVRGTRAPPLDGAMDSPGNSIYADDSRSSTFWRMVQERGQFAAHGKPLVEDRAPRFSLP